jgi:protoporphyrinogen oxidase
MASKSENSEIAVLQTQMDTVLSAVQDIKTLLTAQAANAVQRSEFTDLKLDYVAFKKDHEDRMRVLEEKLNQDRGSQMNRKELLGWFVAFGTLMGGLWWITYFFHK